MTSRAGDATRLAVPVARRLLAQRIVAMLLCAAALLLKLVVPAGYMIGETHGRIAIELCTGMAPQHTAMDMPGMRGDMPDHGKSADHHGKPDMPCAFSGLAAAALGAIDPIQLAALLVFILAMGSIPAARPAWARHPHLRPPLRGPPAHS